MKVLEFGNYFNERDSFEYMSTKNVLEYDMILISLRFIGKNSEQYDSDQYQKRRQQLEDFIHFKNIPLVYFTPLPDYIRTEYNNVITNKEVEFFVPVPELQTEAQQGNEIGI